MAHLSEAMLTTWVAVETWCGTAREDAECGQSMAEYALILAMVALMALAMLVHLGQPARNVFNNVAETMSGAAG